MTIHDGYYEVSDLGNVRRAKPGIATFVGRPVMAIVSAGGYQQVTLSGERTRRAYVHQIVLEAFIGPRCKNMVVNHKNGIKIDNRLTNLEYVSYQDNAKHAVRLMGRRKGPKMPAKPKVGFPSGDRHWTKKTPHKIARGDRMPHCKMSPDLVVEARRRVANGEMQKTLAKEFGISVGQMSRIIRGTRWTYL